jgi:hypothetical protein
LCAQISGFAAWIFPFAVAAFSKTAITSVHYIENRGAAGEFFPLFSRSYGKIAWTAPLG